MLACGIRRREPRQTLRTLRAHRFFHTQHPRYAVNTYRNHRLSHAPRTYFQISIAPQQEDCPGAEKGAVEQVSSICSCRETVPFGVGTLLAAELLNLKVVKKKGCAVTR